MDNIVNRNLLKKIIPKLSFNFPYTIDEYLKNPIMENYHYHSSFSNTMVADSPTNNEDYAKRIKELEYKCIFSGEHGTMGNQHEVYELSEKYKLNYRHSVEAYWVKDRHEKDGTNCHICLIATNQEGKGDINYIISIANEDGYYYRPRIDLELLLSLNPKNVIVTSACIAGFKYDDADEIWLKIANHFKENFFFEIQCHNTEPQKELNKRIIKLAKENNINLIIGLDSHYISEDVDDIKREEILKYKKTKYEDEEGWFLDFPDIETIVKRLRKQGILNEEEIWEAILNTNVFSSNKNEEITFDRHFKIPCVYPNTTYEERVKIFKDIINKEYSKEKNKTQERVAGIQYESSEIIDSGVVDYFLTNRMILQEAIENQNGVLTTTSRGSMASFYVNKLLGFTTVDRFSAEVPIYPERFLTKSRVLSGQMPDCDFNVSEIEPFLLASRKIIGEHGCYPLMAIEKLKEKASWQLYASVNGVSPTIANEISKFIDQYNEKLKYAEEEDKEFINVEDFIPNEYIDIYKKSIEYQGIVINLKVHACGHLIFDGDIRREIGLISAISETTKKRTLCACIEGKYLDSFAYVKDDFLVVDSVGLIKECWDSINEPVPTFDELRDLIDGDELTWGIYEKGITCCINQVEKDSTSRKAQEYKPKNLAESSAFIAGIRPGFKSLLRNFLERKPYTTGEPKIDEILKDSYNYLIYQESIMHVLSYLGLTMGETYDVIKKISKKKYIEHPELLEELKAKLKIGWKDKIGNMNNFEKVWQVIYDAGRYSFNSPHALSMGGDSAYLAYFKSHHTAKFYEVAIKHYQKKNKKEKIDALLKEIQKFYGYHLGEMIFGADNREVIVSEDDKTIYPTMVGIKNMQQIAPIVLYELGKNYYEDINFLFNDILKTELNKTSLEILIYLDYFKNFGDINYIFYQLSIYKETSQIIRRLTECKQLSKTECEKFGLNIEDISKFSSKVTLKLFKELDNESLSKYAKENYRNIMKSVSEKYTYEKTKLLDKISYQIKYLGYSNVIDKSIDPNIYILSEIEFNNWGTPFFNLYNPSIGESIRIKVDRNWYLQYKLNEKDDIGSILRCAFKTKPKKTILLDSEGKEVLKPNGQKTWVNSGEFEEILTVYKVEK